MADDVMREMNNNLRKKEQENRTFAMKGDFLAAGIKSEVEGIKSALTDVYKWSLNAMKDSVTDIIAEGEFCSEDGANKLVHGAIEKAADNVTTKIKEMEIKDSAFVDKVRSDLRARETQKIYKTDYSLVKNEYETSSTKSECSGPSNGIKAEPKAIKKEPKATQKASQRTKVNWSTSKPKSSAVVLSSSDDDFEYKPQSTTSRSSSRRGSRSQESNQSTQIISQTQNTEIIQDTCDIKIKPQRPTEVASRPRTSRSQRSTKTQSSIKSFFQK